MSAPLGPKPVGVRRLESGIKYVLRRRADGRFLGVSKYSARWWNVPSELCPFFTTLNLGPCRDDNFHVSLLRRYRSRLARQEGDLCDLVPYRDVVTADCRVSPFGDDWIGPDGKPLNYEIKK